MWRVADIRQLLKYYKRVSEANYRDQTTSYKVQTTINLFPDQASKFTDYKLQIQAAFVPLLVVRDEYRRRGLTRALLRHVVHEIKELPEVNIETRV